MELPDIYVSTDVETDGQVPGKHSMLSFGSAAYFEDKTLLDTFTANLTTLPESIADPDTLEWFKTQTVAWKACRTHPESPEVALPRYCQWLQELPGRIVFVGYPMIFDFRFIDYYLHRFVGKNPFGYAAIDIRSYVMGMHNTNYQYASMEFFPSHWFDELAHTHIALDDAMEQGALFCNILREQRKMNLIKKN